MQDVNAKPDLGTVSTKEANSNHELKFETLNTNAQGCQLPTNHSKKNRYTTCHHAQQSVKRPTI
jgi:hypothetical protein